MSGQINAGMAAQLLLIKSIIGQARNLDITLIAAINQIEDVLDGEEAA